MALTVTSRGGNATTTGTTTAAMDGRSATLAVGSLGVLCIALDNAGNVGSTAAAPTSATDSKGNVWTRQQNGIYDNGAASAGIECAIYTAPITVALLTTDTLTLTWIAGVTVSAKAWTWYEVIPSAGNAASYLTGGVGTGATAANGQITTASIAVGDAVIAGYFSENVAAVTGDSDSTNGSWAAQQTQTVGSTTSGVRIATQQKVQTTTPSTQSYDCTVSSQDRIVAYIAVHEVVNTTVTPSVLALVIATFAPLIRLNKIATPPTLALTLTKFAPTVRLPKLVTPGTLALTITKFAPTVSTPRLATPPTKTLGLATFAPTASVSNNARTTPSTLSLTLAPFAPVVSTPRVVVPITKSISLVTFAPGVVTPRLATPGKATLAITTFDPTVEVTTGNDVVATPARVALSLTTFAPNVITPRTVTPGTLALSLSPFAPNVLISTRVVPAPLSITLTTFAPTVGSASGDLLVTTDTLNLILSSYAPSVVVSITLGADFSVVVPAQNLIAQTVLQNTRAVVPAKVPTRRRNA